MLVGTPITGALTGPAPTLGRPPPIPATTTTHSAARRSSSRDSSRPSPATPTSARTSARTPSTASVAAHSPATFRSVVPAVTTSTWPRAGGRVPTASVAGGRLVEDAGRAAGRQGRRRRIVDPQLGQQREDLLGRLALAENYFRN